MTDWTLYVRGECSLCEQFQEDLVGLMGERARQIQLVDVSSDPRLESRYGTKIPILLVDDEIVCMYRVDVERVRAHME